MRRLSCRTFLQTATAATLSTRLKSASSQSPATTEIPYPENGTLIPDDDWRLWIDEKAEWKNDPLFLPEDISWQNGVLCGKTKPLPVTEPTGGWQFLDRLSGINVTLPTTVEQHHWGKFGSRPYTPEEYRCAADAPSPKTAPTSASPGGVAPFTFPPNGRASASSSTSAPPASQTPSAATTESTASTPSGEPSNSTLPRLRWPRPRHDDFGTRAHC
jgi:hypothetical protein